MEKQSLFYNEIESSKKSKYHLETNASGVVSLTQENVFKVLAMISYDPSYKKVFDVTSKGELKNGKNTPITEEVDIDKYTVNDNDNYRDGYFGSSAYWFSKLNESEKCNEFRYFLFKTICAVDNENSTHLNGDGVGRIQIWERLCEITESKVSVLKEFLKTEDFSKEEKMKLLRIISKETSPEKGKHPRKNISFASKYCHYASIALLKEEKEDYADKFPIYDTIVKKALPRYIEVNKENYYSKSVITAYKEFTKAITELSNKERISKNGIDQLLWYYYKGHDLIK